MRRPSTATLLAFALTSASALAQVAPNPTQHSAASPQEPVAVFHVTVVGRTTPAINYRPRHDDTPLDFEGTSLLPKAEGRANISGEKGYIRIDAKFDKIEPATRFGPEYLTYVMWAITPEGRATNLGELQVKGDDGRLKVTTELQAFALIVTAEPYFAVTQPSDVVVMENVVRKGLWDDTNGRVEPLQAKYELLKRGTYLMTTDGASVKWPAPAPGVPLDLAQARNAVEIARLARADQYAIDTYSKAARLLADAEDARKHHNDSKQDHDAGAAGGTDGGGRADHRAAATGTDLPGAAARGGTPARERRARPGACRGRAALAGGAAAPAGRAAAPGGRSAASTGRAATLACRSAASTGRTATPPCRSATPAGRAGESLG